MNETTTALVSIGTLTPVQLFTEGKMNPLIEEITREVRSHVPDISTAKGRKEIASLALRVAKSKVYLDDLGKDLVSEWKEKSKKVDEVRKKMRDDLDSLKEEARKPLTEYEEKEELRLKKHESRILEIEKVLGFYNSENDSNQLKSAIDELSGVEIDDSWDEFKARAETAKIVSLKHLERLLASRIKHEQEQEELKRLRQEKASQEQKEREERIAKEAAQKARIEAEEKARKEAARIEEIRLAEIRKAQEDAERSEREKQDAIRKQKEAEENARLAKEQAEKEKAEAEKRAKESERLRIQKEKEDQDRASAAREADLKHKKTINNAALDAICLFSGVSKEQSQSIVQAIALGKVPNVKINY